MKNQYNKILAKALIFSSAISTPLISLAVCTPGTICNPLDKLGTDIPGLISIVLGYVVRIGGVVAIFAFIYAGFRFVQARGNPTELKTAREIFKNTVLGVAILLGAQIIASIIVGTINNLR